MKREDWRWILGYEWVLVQVIWWFVSVLVLLVMLKVLFDLVVGVVVIESP